MDLSRNSKQGWKEVQARLEMSPSENYTNSKQGKAQVQAKLEMIPTLFLLVSNFAWTCSYLTLLGCDFDLAWT